MDSNENGSLKTINCDYNLSSHFLFINWVDVFSVCQRKGAKRRLKSRGNGSVGSAGVASERAVSIPQITYDHIDDSEEKKDVTFFREEPRGAVEGNIPERATILLSYRSQGVIVTCFSLRSTNSSACFSKKISQSL